MGFFINHSIGARREQEFAGWENPSVTFCWRHKQAGLEQEPSASTTE
jgi:hypothetical protein